MLEHLARRGSAWPEASATAIRDLRARMKRGTDKLSTYERIDTMNQAVEPSRLGAIATQGAAPTPRDASYMNNDEDYGLIGTKQHIDHVQTASGGRLPLERLQGSALTTTLAPNTTINENTTFHDIFQNPRLPGQDSTFSTLDTLDPFTGFDIPFWLEQDHDWDIFQDFS